MWCRGSSEDINTNDTSTPTQVPVSGPITRVRARQLNHQVSSLLSSCLSYLDHGDACTLVLVRNQGECNTLVLRSYLAPRFWPK